MKKFTEQLLKATATGWVMGETPPDDVPFGATENNTGCIEDAWC